MSGFCRSACSMKRFALIVVLYWSLQWTETDLTLGFFRTLVACDPPVPHEGICPGGSFYAQGQCSPKPRGDVDWSGSAHCFDKAYVLTETTKFRGSFYAIVLLANTLPGIFIANSLLDKIGRKKVMLISMASTVCLLLLFALSCRYNKVLIVVGGFIGAFFNSFQTAQTAMTADLAAADESSRALQMGAVSAFQNLGVVAGVSGGFFVLQADITDYFYVWVTFALVAFFVTFLCWSLLKESFVPAKGMDEFSCRRQCLMTFHDLAFSISQIKRDEFSVYAFIPMFTIIFAVSGVSSISTSWAIAICGYSQAVASLAGILQPICVSIAGMTISVPLRIWGGYNTCIFSVSVVALGMVISGLGGFARVHAGGLFWCGGATTAFGLGQVSPSFQSLLSVRVSSSFQGRLFAVQALLLLVASASGSWFGSNILFKLESTTSSSSISPGRLALPWTFNALLCLVSILFMCRLRKAQKGVSPLLLGEIQGNSFQATLLDTSGLI